MEEAKRDEFISFLLPRIKIEKGSYVCVCKLVDKNYCSWILYIF